MFFLKHDSMFFLKHKSNAQVISLLILLSLFASCAGKSVKQSDLPSPENAFGQVCKSPKKYHGLEGSIWIQTRSKGVSGQFPADVVWKNSGPILITITNPLGGKEAVVELKSSEFKVSKYAANGKMKTVQRGKTHWSGIPLRFAESLFTGQYPCPSSLPQQMNWRENTLVVLDGADTYEYNAEWTKADSSQNENLVQKIVWKTQDKSTDPLTIEFRDPDSEFFGQAKRWTAKSEQGEIHLRWKNREAQNVVQ